MSDIKIFRANMNTIKFFDSITQGKVIGRAIGSNCKFINSIRAGNRIVIIGAMMVFAHLTRKLRTYEYPEKHKFKLAHCCASCAIDVFTRLTSLSGQISKSGFALPCSTACS